MRRPLEAIRARFGEVAMPKEGEYPRPTSEGGFEMVIPKSEVASTFGAAAGELSDEW